MRADGSTVARTKASLDVFPGLSRLLGRIIESTIEFFLVPVGDWNGLSGGREAVPDLLDELQALIRGEVEDFVEQGWASHTVKLACSGCGNKWPVCRHNARNSAAAQNLQARCS